MKLYFLRHTEAEDGDVDDLRRLSRKGRRDARALGRYFSEIELGWDRAFTSPLVRARETAAIVLKECPLTGGAKLAEVDALRNGTGKAGFFRWLASLPEVESVLMVGHEPSLSAWVRQFLGIPVAERLLLPKGGLARVDSDDRKTGSLRLLISPKTIA